MADVKISALGAIASIAGEDLVAVVDDPSVTPASRKATIDQIKTYINTGALTASSTDTLTNKTIDADGTGNSITNIENADIKASAGIDATKLADGSVSSTELQYINSLSSNAQTQIDTKITTSSTDTLTNKTFDANGTGNSISNIDLADLSTGAKTEALIFAVSDETTALTAGTSAGVFRMPYGFTLTAVRASVTTAGTGSVITVDINESATTILSTKLTIDATEKTSTTAATAAVISDTALADDSEITIDIDTVDSGGVGAGLKIYLIGYQT